MIEGCFFKCEIIVDVPLLITPHPTQIYSQSGLSHTWSRRDNFCPLYVWLTLMRNKIRNRNA